MSSMARMPITFDRKITSVVRHDRGFDVQFTCGRRMWFAAPPNPNQQYPCSVCFDHFLQQARAASKKETTS